MDCCYDRHLVVPVVYSAITGVDIILVILAVSLPSTWNDQTDVISIHVVDSDHCNWSNWLYSLFHFYMISTSKNCSIPWANPGEGDTFIWPRQVYKMYVPLNRVWFLGSWVLNMVYNFTIIIFFSILNRVCFWTGSVKKSVKAAIEQSSQVVPQCFFQKS